MGKKIIIVDDSSTVRQQVAAALSAAGYQCIEAVDGKNGLEKIDQHADAALVIIDINMPVMTGLEMVESLADKRGPRPALPIIMLTTEGDPLLIERAKKAGAKGWIVKPFKPEVLVSVVRKLAGAA